MKHFQKLLYLAASCAIVAITFAAIGQRTVQAVVATLVRNVDEPGRNVYQSFTNSVGGFTSCNVSSCTDTDELNFDGVQTGKRLVITTISGSFDLPASDELLSLALNVSTGNTHTSIDLHPVIVSSDSVNVHYSFSQNIHGYQDDASGSPSFSLPGMFLTRRSSSGNLLNNFRAALIGYTVSLP